MSSRFATVLCAVAACAWLLASAPAAEPPIWMLVAPCRSMPARPLATEAVPAALKLVFSVTFTVFRALVSPTRALNTSGSVVGHSPGEYRLPLLTKRIAPGAVTLISLVLVTLGGLGSFLGWQRVGEKWPSSFGDRVTRDRFMAVMGLLMAGIFFVVVVAQGIAAIIFHPCQL